MKKILNKSLRLVIAIANLFLAHTSFAQGSQTFNSSGNFTVPAGVTNITVQAWGGGGAGGGSTNAGTLIARGGGGGGGGAFASNTISVTPGSVLSVVVAGQTAGTSGATGANGGSSTITGFESQILAAGGSGGIGNTAGGTVAGGPGGTIATSAGTTRIAGTDGGSGNTATSPTVASSGAGGNGANSGGTGGALVTGSGVTAPGNNGNAPGGGGSGGRTSQTAGNEPGGTGAAGRLIITWTCPAATISYSPISYCKSVTSTLVNLSGTTGGTFSATPAGLSINSSTGEINPSTSTATTYTVHYQLGTTGNGCTAIDATFSVTVNPTPVATVTGQSNISCFAANDGTIEVTASNGASPYTFAVDGDSPTPTWLPATGTNLRLFTGLLPNHAYRARVKDNNGCISR